MILRSFGCDDTYVIKMERSVSKRATLLTYLQKKIGLPLNFAEVKLLHKLLVHDEPGRLGVVKVLLQVVELWWDSAGLKYAFCATNLNISVNFLEC